MTAIALRSEERVGLILAAAAHAGLVALLIWRPPSGPAVPVPERIEVTISDEVGLTSTSPDPSAQAAPDIAPEIGEAAPAPEPAPPEPAPEPPRTVPPKPAPKVEPAPPRPVPKAEPRPVPKAVPRPAPKAPPRPAVRPSPRPAPKAAPKPAAAARPNPAPAARPAARPAANTASKPTTTPGGSRIGSDFLKGVPGAQAAGPARAAPAAAMGPAVRSSLASAISRQLKPHWAAPQGAEAELLVTVLAFDLNRDGTLAGRPRVVSQSGETEANSAQKARHAEQAIRAVQLAAPFDLPDQYYDGWKRVASFRFDRRLSQ